MSKKKFNYGRELALIMLIILHILFLTVLWFGNLTGNRDLTIFGMCGGVYRLFGISTTEYKKNLSAFERK